MIGFTPIVIGIDEVGRGALAGPVVVGAVGVLGDEDTLRKSILAECNLKTLKDSKKLTTAQRERIDEYIRERVVCGIGAAEASEIDALGLNPALCLAAERALMAIQKQGYQPSRIVADAGLRHPFESTVPTEWFIRGDERIFEITLASIVAKVWRDSYMHDLDASVPGYGFLTNVGYGTAKHYQGLSELGKTVHHRQLFLKKLS